MRRSLPFLLVLAASFAEAQELGQIVSYTTKAVPVSRAVEELSAKTGVQLVVSPAVANDVVVIHVKDAPLGDLMNRIADAISGQWRPEGDGFRLTAAAAARRQQERTEQEERLKALHERVAKFAEEALKPGQSNQQGAPSMPSFSAPTAQAAIARMLGGIDLNLLASLPDNGRIVFATQPTPTQRPLPATIGPIIDTLIKEHNAAAAKAPPVDKEQESLIPEFMRGMMRNMRPVSINTPPAKVMLVATRSGFMESLRIDLRLYDAKGQVLFSGSHDIGFNFEGLTRLAEGMAEPAEQAADKDDTRIEFSAETKEIQSMFAGMMEPNAQTKMSAELRAKLLRPDLHDPLSYFHSEALHALAKAKSAQLVAHLPDTLFGMDFGGGGPGASTVGAALRVFSEGETKLAHEGDWILVTPAAPAEARSKTFDRRALAQLIVVSESQGTAPLDDLARYALVNNPPLETPGTLMYILTFAPNAMGIGLGGMTNWDALRLYGSLSQSQRQILVQGGSLPLSGLSGGAAAAARTLLYGATTSLRVEQPGQKDTNEELPGFFRMPMMRFMGEAPASIHEEPTHVMPSGFPAGARLEFAIKEEAVVRPIGGDSPMLSMMGVLGSEEIAMLRYFKEDPTMFQMMGGFMPVLDKLRLGSRSIITMRFQIAANIHQEEMLHDNRVPDAGPMVTLMSLPEGLRAQVEERLARFKKEGFLGINPAMMGGMGRNRPPQP